MKDKLARWAKRSEKTAGHDFRREEGMKWREKDFKGEVFSILKTSEGVTGGREKKVEAARGESENTNDGERRLS